MVGRCLVVKRRCGDWGGRSEREKKNNGVNNDFLTLFSL